MGTDGVIAATAGCDDDDDGCDANAVECVSDTTAIPNDSNTFLAGSRMADRA